MLKIIETYVSSIMFMLSVYGFGAILFNKRKKNKWYCDLIVFLIACLLDTIIFLYIDNTAKTISLCFVFMITFKFIFNLSYDKAIFLSIAYAVLAIIPDLITTASTIYIFNVGKTYFYEILAGGIICNAIVSLIMILLTFVLRKPLRKLVNYDISTNKKIILIGLLTLTSLAIFFYNLIHEFEINNNIIGYLVVIITLIVILFSMFKQKMDNDLIVKKYDDLLNIMKNYESDIEEQRTIIHETENELMTIESKIKDKEDEKIIIKYIDSILEDKVTVSMVKYSKFKYLPSNGLKGFFYYKFIEAEKNDLKVSVNISEKIENSFLGKIETKDFKDLARIIGVYLDNAIEASSKSTDKKLGIEIYLINNVVKIIISNTYENSIETEKIGKVRYSTKGKNRGHGLLLVNRILNNNTMFETETKINENLYTQILKIKKKKNK